MVTGMRMTLEQFLAMPEEKPYLEYVDGEARPKPMGYEERAFLAGQLIILLGAYRATHGGHVGPEPSVYLPEFDSVRLPDVAYWAKGRPRGERGKMAPPTLAIEILSPDQRKGDLREKCRAFRRSGTDACWLIDPYTRTVEVFEGDCDAVPVAPREVLSVAAMSGFTLAQADLWSVLDED